MLDTSPTTAITTAPAKNKPGRPRAYVDLSQVTELAAQGYSMNDIARRLGVSERLCWARCAEDPAFKEAYDDGLDDLFNLVTKTLRQLILEKSPAAVFFTLRNKFKWLAGSQSEITIKHEPAPMPQITSHILDLAAEHSALLDSPDIDAVDAEFSEVFSLEDAMR